MLSCTPWSGRLLRSCPVAKRARGEKRHSEAGGRGRTKSKKTEDEEEGIGKRTGEEIIKKPDFLHL